LTDRQSLVRWQRLKSIMADQEVGCAPIHNKNVPDLGLVDWGGWSTRQQKIDCCTVRSSDWSQLKVWHRQDFVNVRIKDNEIHWRKDCNTRNNWKTKSVSNKLFCMVSVSLLWKKLHHDQWPIQSLKTLCQIRK
jgi:hypothetical protein